RDGPREPLERQLPDRAGLDLRLDGGLYPLRQQDLPGLRLRREALGEDDAVPDAAVVVPAFEADASERRVPGRDACAEAELVALLLPAAREVAKTLAHRAGHGHRLQLMAVDRERVVEPHHHPVSGEVLERAAMRDDELAHRLLVLPQHPENLLRLRRLGEGGEPAEIEEHDRDLPAVSLEHLGAVFARDERRDLRGEEPRKLLPLALDGLEEIEVRDRDRVGADGHAPPFDDPHEVGSDLLAGGEAVRVAEDPPDHDIFRTAQPRRTRRDGPQHRAEVERGRADDSKDLADRDLALERARE